MRGKRTEEPCLMCGAVVAVMLIAWVAWLVAIIADVVSKL